MPEYGNEEITLIIADRIHSERDRKILLRWYVDGASYERIAEEFDLSSRQIQNIIRKHENTIFRHA